MSVSESISPRSLALFRHTHILSCRTPLATVQFAYKGFPPKSSLRSVVAVHVKSVLTWFGQGMIVLTWVETCVVYWYYCAGFRNTNSILVKFLSVLISWVNIIRLSRVRTSRERRVTTKDLWMNQYGVSALSVVTIGHALILKAGQKMCNCYLALSTLAHTDRWIAVSWTNFVIVSKFSKNFSKKQLV